MPTLPDVSMQPAFFASQAVIEDGQIVGYAPEWHVYHRDTLQSMGTAPTQTEAVELADRAIEHMAVMRAQPAPEPEPFHMEPVPITVMGQPASPDPGPETAAQSAAPTAVSNWRHRYSIRANPEARVGEMVTVSFRLPENVRDALVSRAAILKAAGDPGIDTPTDALQDAVVCWLLMEGVI